MLQSSKRLIGVAFCAFVLVLTSCGGDPPVRVKTSTTRKATTADERPELALRERQRVLSARHSAERLASAVRTLDMARVLIAEAHAQEAEAHAHQPAAVPAPFVQLGPATTTALPITGDYHTWPDWPLWHAVGLCEQRGDTEDGIAWHGSPAGGLPGSGYPGGLGMSRDFWREFAPIAGVATTNGALASPGEQIRVGRAGSHNGTRMGGWSSWPGCIKRNGG